MTHAPTLPDGRSCAPAVVGGGVASVALLLALTSSLLGGPRQGFLQAEVLPSPACLLMVSVTALLTSFLVARRRPVAAAVCMIAGTLALATHAAVTSPWKGPSDQGTWTAPDGQHAIVVTQNPHSLPASSRLRLEENGGSASRYWTVGCLTPQQRVDAVRWTSSTTVTVRIDGRAHDIRVGADGPEEIPDALPAC
ncbi:hypothetical protein ACTQ49_07335 [Luteococcus sp. Sow4_B9]|uniref:hypothetical protein n=1 Tax=Luteococcus sp. Sow4_B9 TaxID=3438792 RepID=UPI003F95C509